MNARRRPDACSVGRSALEGSCSVTHCHAPVAACGCIVLGITLCSATPRPGAQSAWSDAGTRAVEVDTKDADYYVNRGNAFADNKDYDRAIADYNKAIELDPQNAYAYNSRADTLREAGKPAQGLPDAEKALQLDSNNAEFWDTRAQIFAALGRRRRQSQTIDGRWNSIRI